MAVWIEDRKVIADNNRTRNGGEIISYGADTLADLTLLPHPNGSNQGSTCFVLENSSVHKLGADPSIGVNGWVEL
jgi:hypothetical protein